MKAFDENIKDDVIKNLDSLAKLREVIESFQQEQDELVDQAFLNSPGLNRRRFELIKNIEVLLEKSSVLSKRLIEGVLKVEESVKGERLQAAFTKGRTTWDTSALSGYALAHPELEKLKKVGKPSVSIREVKNKKES